MNKLEVINSILEMKGFTVSKLKNESENDIFLEVLDSYNKQIKQARILKWQGSYKGILQLKENNSSIYVHHCTL